VARLRGAVSSDGAVRERVSVDDHGVVESLGEDPAGVSPTMPPPTTTARSPMSADSSGSSRSTADIVVAHPRPRIHSSVGPGGCRRESRPSAATVSGPQSWLASAIAWVDGSGAFNSLGRQRTPMQCHFCDRDADVGVEHGGVTVGVCEDHLRERVAELADGEWPEGIAAAIEDLDSGRGG